MKVKDVTCGREVDPVCEVAGVEDVRLGREGGERKMTIVNVADDVCKEDCRIGMCDDC